MNETKSKSPLFSHKSRDYTTVSSTHLFIQSLIIKKIGCSKARLLSQLLLNSLINTLFHLFSACTKRNVDFMLSYDKWLPALTPHRHKSDVSVCFYPTARKWMSVFFKMSNWYSESNGKKKKHYCNWACSQEQYAWVDSLPLVVTQSGFTIYM